MVKIVCPLRMGEAGAEGELEKILILTLSMFNLRKAAWRSL